jgi:hypothetical protein
MGYLCLPKDGSLLWVSKPISRAYGWSMTVVGTRHAPSPYYAPGPFRPYEEEVAAERNHLPTKALRTLGEDAHRLLGLPIACPFWTVQNIFSILTCVLARGEPRMFFVQLPEAAGKAVRPPALEPLPLNRLFGQLSQI